MKIEKVMEVLHQKGFTVELSPTAQSILAFQKSRGRMPMIRFQSNGDKAVSFSLLHSRNIQTRSRPTFQSLWPLLRRYEILTRDPVRLLPGPSHCTHEEWAFVQVIASNLHDQTNWLVYADWLEERGRSVQAHLIRTWAFPVLHHLILVRDFIARCSPESPLSASWKEYTNSDRNSLSVYLRRGSLLFQGHLRPRPYNPTKIHDEIQATANQNWNDLSFIFAAGKVCDQLEYFHQLALPVEAIYKLLEPNCPIPSDVIDRHMEETGYMGDYAEMTPEEAQYWTNLYHQYQPDGTPNDHQA